MEQLTIDDIVTYKFLLDFQTILKHNDDEVKYKYQKFHDTYDFCVCPLLRDSLNTQVSIV